MSTKPRRRPHEALDADPWWSDPKRPLADVAVPGSRSRRHQHVRVGTGWAPLRLLLVPLRILGVWARQNPRVRRLALRLAIALVGVAFLASSVGVILINNVVIGRTAELGELDDRRRELRRENALLGAESAQLSAPPVVVRRAQRDLGMVRTTELPRFIYLVPASRTLTPFQRKRLVFRAQRLRAAETRRDAAAIAPARAAATTTSTATTTEQPR